MATEQREVGVGTEAQNGGKRGRERGRRRKVKKVVRMECERVTKVGKRSRGQEKEESGRHAGS